jgi:hypothetical protein
MSDPFDKLSWEETPRTVVIGVVGLVPKVGGVFSKLLGLIWPDPKSAETLIKESEADEGVGQAGNRGANRKI